MARLPPSKKQQGKIRKKAREKGGFGSFFNSVVYQTGMGRVRGEECLVRSADGLVVHFFPSEPDLPLLRSSQVQPSAFLLSSGLSMPYHLTLDPATARAPCKSPPQCQNNSLYHTCPPPLQGLPACLLQLFCFYTKSVDFARESV